jgi:DNA-binding NtrC family response regulator
MVSPDPVAFAGTNRRSLPLRDARTRWVRYFEHTYVGELLARTAGNVTAAATLAGVDRIYLHRMITRAGLREKLLEDRCPKIP